MSLGMDPVFGVPAAIKALIIGTMTQSVMQQVDVPEQEALSVVRSVHSNHYFDEPSAESYLQMVREAVEICRANQQARARAVKES